MITNSELIILSLISEKPRHGYNIEAEIEYRGMREWTEIGFSSIYYLLGRLEKMGLLSGTVDPYGEKPARKTYEVTPHGMDILHEAVIERLSCPRPHNSDFDLGLSCLPILTRGETINALETHRQTLSHKITQIKLKMEKDIQNPSTPPHVKILFDHNLALMRSEMDWVELIILEMKGK